LQRKVAEVAEAEMSAKVQRVITVRIGEIIMTIRKRRISGSSFIASGEGTTPRTARASNAANLQWLPTLQRKY
jgi:hypothetical protein